MEAALDDNMTTLQNARPEQVDDVTVSAHDCVVHNGHAFYISCRACVINCSCGEKHHLFCWFDRKGNWVGEDNKLHNRCMTTFRDGFIKVDRLSCRPVECMPTVIKKYFEKNN